MVHMKRMTWWRRLAAMGGAVVTASVVTACGPPDFQRMRPTVTKLTAEVILADAPHWQDADVDHAVSGSGVSVRVDHTSLTDASTLVQSRFRSAAPGLIVTVGSGAPPPDWLTVAMSHPSAHFEWIGSAAPASVPSNVRVVAPDDRWVAAAEGALAGVMLTDSTPTTPTPAVGWTGGAAATVSKRDIQQLVSTLLAIAPTATVQLVQLPDGPWPSIVVADRPLAATEFHQLEAHGCVVISLCPQPAGVDAVEPSIPGPDVLHEDVLAFATGGWKPGVDTVKSTDILQWSSRIPPKMVGQVDAWMTGWNASGSTATALSAGQQQRWSTVLARGT